MAFFRKKPDPITDRARALKDEIAALEAQISRLDSQIARRTGTGPDTGAANRGRRVEPAASTPASREPVFEEVDLGALEPKPDAAAGPEHYTDLGVRKYDLTALVSRLKNHLRGPATTNPKLVSYLAAGGIQGLRPMRYEKRVARNRFIALVLVLFLIMLGIVAVFVRG